ncbi:hypothetical protein [Lentzea sp. NEAU-D7]|uniref:hypothetical protein n=1 Tax=Lentzea sp. NEAU-D7 TaxID=2994667 RepID=UPI00224A6EBD|nr:hypothetical protein [Lentzea sp. NEAU-D7]MCX2950872.1 hypothetical protein [Lentzea sp. NEAU-D7]
MHADGVAAMSGGVAVAEEPKLVNVQSSFEQMQRMGLQPVPLPNSTGNDDGLLYFRVFPQYVDTVAVWAETYAVALRVPARRNWAAPFEPSPVIYRCVGTLHQVVSGLSKLAPYSGAGAEHRRF